MGGVNLNFKKKLGIILSSVLLALNLSTYNTTEAATQQLEVHYINVGQGDATYIELPDGTDILIDSGRSGSGQAIVNYLKSQETSIDIEYLIATHPDADHVGGMKSVFPSLRVKNFYYPKDVPSSTITWKDVLSLANKEGCRIIDANSGVSLSIAGVTIKLIQPKIDYSTDNYDSVVTFIDYKNAEFLFTGDIEMKVEADLVSKKLVSNVDFMSVPHHGSKYSSSLNFLKIADPEYSIISVGKNSYGHPSADIINRYKSIGSKIYRTDVNGNVVIKTDGSTAKINNTSIAIK